MYNSIVVCLIHQSSLVCWLGNFREDSQQSKLEKRWGASQCFSPPLTLVHLLDQAVTVAARLIPCLQMQEHCQYLADEVQKLCCWWSPCRLPRLRLWHPETLTPVESHAKVSTTLFLHKCPSPSLLPQGVLWGYNDSEYSFFLNEDVNHHQRNHYWN